MKKFIHSIHILVFVFICTANKLQAQNKNTVLLNADETVPPPVQTVNITHSACKEIRLEPSANGGTGYRFAADVEPGNIATSMRAYIDPTMICDVDYIPNGGITVDNLPSVPDPSYEVGATPGSFAVTPTGAATYNIPMSVSPGTAGMQPNLSISYNSQSGDGLLGVGWNLSGLSSITRVGKTMYYDNAYNFGDREYNVSGVHMNYDDMFALDGNRLFTIADGQVYGHAETEYVVELENFSKIISYGQTGDGPSYFVVYAKDGSAMQYGVTPDSRIEGSNSSTVLTWLLDKVTDSKGYYMTFHYYQNRSTGEYRPDYILYSCRDGSAPYNKVKFVYGTRQDKQSAYVNGNLIQHNVLLTNVEMYNGSTKMHEYAFNYGMDMNSHLSEVIEYGADGKRFNSTKVVWSTNNKNPVLANQTGSENGSIYSINEVSPFIHVIDFNGDGFDDLVWLAEGSTGIGRYRVDVNNKNGTFTYGAQQSFTPVDYSGSIFVNGAKDKPNFISADFTGDGLDDMIVFSQDKNKKQLKCTLLKSTGSTLVEDVSQNFEVNFSDKDKAAFKYTVGDFDGDGASDVFVYFYDEDKGYVITYRGAGTQIQVLGEGSGNTANGDIGDESLQFYTTDLNGDGRQEIFYTYQSTGNILQFNGTKVEGITVGNYPNTDDRIYVGDFNGDGKTDLLTWSDPSKPGGNLWEIAYSKGDFHNFDRVTAPLPSWGDPNATMTYHRCFINDYNGDGRSDILDIGVANGNSTSYFGVYYSIGNGFTSGGTNNPDPLKFADEDGNSLGYFGDFDGDGKRELYYSIKDNSSDIRKLSIMPGADINKVNIISDGLCNRAYIRYNTLPIMANQPTPQYIKSSDAIYPIIDYQKPVTVAVESYMLNLSYVTGSYIFNHLNYSYTGAKVHMQGKGFLGFTKFKQEGDGIVNEQEYDISMYGLITNFYQPTLFKSTTSTTSGQNISEERFYYEFQNRTSLPLGSWCALDYFYYPKETLKDDFLSGTSTTTDVTQDKFGNVTSQTSTNTAGTSVTTNTYEQKAVSWNINNRLTSTTTTLTRIGKPSYTRSTSFENNGVGGSLSKKTTDAGVVTEYTYNPAALPETIKVSAPNINPLITSMEYDASVRFVTKITNPMGHVTESTYNPLYGNALTKTDANGLTTGFAYDGFGRLQETTSPTGTKSTNTLAWDIVPAKYSYKSIMTDPSGAVSKQYYDAFGRVVQSETNGFDGSVISTTKTYNNLNQLVQETEPNNTGLFTSYLYETDYKRLKRITNPNGSGKEYSYTGKTTSVTVTDNTGTRTSSTTVDDAGLTISTTDPDGNTLSYLYNSSGQPKQITAPGGAITSMDYDAYGRQTKLTDPDAGVTTYAYDALGELTAQQTAKQLAANSSYSTTITYDKLGRVLTNADPQEGNTIYAYDTKTNGIGMIGSVTGPNNSSDYTYDSFGRLTSKTETLTGNVHFTHSYEYDNLSRITQETYPNGFKVNSVYNSNGYLEKLVNAKGNTDIWTCNAMNARGQIISSQAGNDMVTEKTYSPLGFLSKVQLKDGNTVKWNMGYTFDEQTGNLLSRSDNLRNLSETFTYDKLDRLEKGVNQSGITTLQMVYAANGNIQNKLDAGEYLYDGTKPHAVSAIKNYTADIPTTQQDIAYTSFNKAKTITEGSNTLAFTYDCNHHRIKSLLTYNGNYKRDITYMGDFEQINQWGLSSSVNYISSPDGLAAMYVTVNGSSSMYYVNTDHLGSIDLVYKEGNNTAPYAEQSFDAWGRNRNAATWVVYPSSWAGTAVPWLIRGYTGHEHHRSSDASLDLINMNGRMYDPVLGRMLSPDNYASATSTQKCNRYTYAINNPLKYTDPTGNWEGWDDVAAMVIGGGLNVAAHWSQINAGGKFHFGQFASAFVIGAVAGEVALYTGGAAISAAGLSTAATFGTVTAAGAIGGAAGSATGSLIMGVGNNAAFGDPYSAKQFARDVAIGTVTSTLLAYPGYRIAQYLRSTKSGADIGTNPGGISKAVEGDAPDPSLTIEKMQATNMMPAEDMPNTISIQNNLNREGIKQIDLTSSPRQALHYGETAMPGRSVLTEEPSVLLKQINDGTIGNVRIAGDKLIVDFGRPIGNYYLNGNLVSPSNYGTVIINSQGQIHIYPANPIQW